MASMDFDTVVGGLFYDNYPGGGLMAGSVFGRLVGTGAARFAVGNG